MDPLPLPILGGLRCHWAWITVACPPNSQLGDPQVADWVIQCEPHRPPQLDGGLQCCSARQPGWVFYRVTTWVPELLPVHGPNYDSPGCPVQRNCCVGRPTFIPTVGAFTAALYCRGTAEPATLGMGQRLDNLPCPQPAMPMRVLFPFTPFLPDCRRYGCAWPRLDCVYTDSAMTYTPTR